ncbi:hypothetical protein JTB14_000932 [Gonioctena quinquepunctata]|nr:hypothetical protein JTB14_000932 [Gonioctena quinquepunctata]
MNFTNMLQSFVRLQQEYGSFYKFWIGSRSNLMITKPEYLEELFSSSVHIAKSNGYDLFKPWLGDGLLVSTGKKWKSRRKMITPTFHFKILEEFMKVFNKEFDVLIDILTEETERNPGRSLDITRFVNAASLDIICETAFGSPLHAQTNGHPEYFNAVLTLLETITMRFFSAWLRNPFFFRFSSYYKKYIKSLKISHDFTNRVIKDRRDKLKMTMNKGKNIGDDGIKKKSALLDMLLESTNHGNELTDEDISEEVNTFMFEGHDTSQSAICYTLYAICQNPGVQSKVYQEIIETIGDDSKTEITISLLNDLNYLDIVVKEALRIYTTVPIIERRLEENWKIDGFEIPKDTTISIFLYGMNHSPDVFPEPEKFNPERFLPENQSKRHTYAYVPFSAGSRNCIGQKFALYELKTCIVKFLIRFDFEVHKWHQNEAEDQAGELNG